MAAARIGGAMAAQQGKGMMMHLCCLCALCSLVVTRGNVAHSCLDMQLIMVGWWEAECDAFCSTMLWMFVWEHKQRLMSDVCVIVDHKFF